MKEIAKKENISADYLEKIFTELEKKGLIESKRGPSGGYRLTEKPENISLNMILKILENKFSLVECLDEGCDRISGCPVFSTWKRLDQEIKEKLKDITLKDLIEDNK